MDTTADGAVNTGYASQRTWHGGGIIPQALRIAHEAGKRMVVGILHCKRSSALLPNRMNRSTISRATPPHSVMDACLSDGRPFTPPMRLFPRTTLDLPDPPYPNTKTPACNHKTGPMPPVMVRFSA